jgi:hypothetical protein
VDGTPRQFIVGPNVNLTIEKCSFKSIRFQIDPAANVQVSDSSVDDKPLTVEMLRRAKQ